MCFYTAPCSYNHPSNNRTHACYSGPGRKTADLLLCVEPCSLDDDFGPGPYPHTLGLESNFHALWPQRKTPSCPSPHHRDPQEDTFRGGLYRSNKRRRDIDFSNKATKGNHAGRILRRNPGTLRSFPGPFPTATEHHRTDILR